MLGRVFELCDVAEVDVIGDTVRLERDDTLAELVVVGIGRDQGHRHGLRLSSKFAYAQHVGEGEIPRP